MREVGRGADDGRHVTAEADQLVHGHDSVSERIQEIEREALQGASEGNEFVGAHGRNNSS